MIPLNDGGEVRTIEALFSILQLSWVERSIYEVCNLPCLVPFSVVGNH